MVMVMRRERVGRNEASTKGQRLRSEGTELDPEGGPIFWSIYFYPLANLEFPRSRRAAIEEKVLAGRVNSTFTANLKIFLTWP